MTGAYLRVKRDGKWQNIEVEHMTNEERANAFRRDSFDTLVSWINMLCNELNKIESLLISLEKEGIIMREKK